MIEIRARGLASSSIKGSGYLLAFYVGAMMIEIL